MKVSICIPAYNDEAGITRLIDSIKKQTFTDYEVILSDDSAESVAERIKNQIEASGNNFKYFRHETHTGPADNWNNSIALASGDYIKIMHQDDFFTNEDSLKHYVELLEKTPEADMAFSGSKEVYSDHSFDRCISASDEVSLNKTFNFLFLRNCIGAPSAIIFKKGVDVKFDSRLKWFVDIDFYMAILQSNSKYAFTREPLVSIGHGEGQVTNTCVYNSKVLSTEGKILYKKFNLNKDFACKLHYYFFLKNSLLHFIRKIRNLIRSTVK